jgi:hypothetical protein
LKAGCVLEVLLHERGAVEEEALRQRVQKLLLLLTRVESHDGALRSLEVMYLDGSVNAQLLDDLISKALLLLEVVLF